MEFRLQLQTFTIDGRSVSLFIPDEKEVKQLYKEGKIAFPYWSQVWPSAIALSQFILNHPDLVINKKIIELAAGLGLPSMFASYHARHVICSDQDEHAVAIMEKTIHHLGLKNCTSEIMDWNDLPENLEADVILLSDINYNPDSFPALKKLVHTFLQKNITIILATPQRLMAKEFVDEIIPYAKSNEEIVIKETMISVFVI